MNFYSAQPFLAWVLNTYFYGDEHYLFLAPFYPYRLPNPRSSSPYHIYGQLYRVWKDRDEHDPVVLSKRMRLRNGVIAKEASGQLTTSQAADLKKVCDKISLRFLCPVLYRVDMDDISEARRDKQGSGLKGAVEHLVLDIQPGEFEVLLFEYWEDQDLRSLFERSIGAGAALTLLQNNYVSTN